MAVKYQGYMLQNQQLMTHYLMSPYIIPAFI